MNSVMERWIGSCRRELLDRTLVWNQRHLMAVLREYEDSYNTHRPHRALKQAAPLRRLPDNVTDLDGIRVQRRDREAAVTGLDAVSLLGLPSLDDADRPGGGSRT
jgi:transposase InsO family protein